jgi:hypothetical protein
MHKHERERERERGGKGEGERAGQGQEVTATHPRPSHILTHTRQRNEVIRMHMILVHANNDTQNYAQPTTPAS